MTTTTFLCIGISRKHQNFCIGGYDINNKKLIRPVIDKNQRWIPPQLCMLDNGRQLQVLDIVNIQLKDYCPTGCQTENYTIDPDMKWKYVDTYDRTQLDAFVENPDILWLNGDSSFNGFNDRISTVKADLLYTQSVYFIKLQKLDIIIKYENFSNHKKIRGKFTYNDATYILSITDCTFETKYKQQKCGTYTINGPLYAAVSLGEDFGGYRYKLLASII